MRYASNYFFCQMTKEVCSSIIISDIQLWHDKIQYISFPKQITAHFLTLIHTHAHAHMQHSYSFGMLKSITVCMRKTKEYTKPIKVKVCHEKTLIFSILWEHDVSIITCFVKIRKLRLKYSCMMRLQKRQRVDC